MNHKFSVGEIAIYHGAEREAWGEVEIIKVGPFYDPEPVGGLPAPGHGDFAWNVDYIAAWPDGTHWGVDECVLRKRRSPETPADEEFQQDLRRWLNSGVSA